eukprot:gnl/MRDRNA2_/MRDRNA2_78032_c0_seq1.p1 gnl/MRDRNA2_/MRDRNA2_78032_c0~~gnl/MRDRNA2_/MRDRNA2_78032_c0_seq1.p1  ORF type:complete len:168 (-),score=20.14 gnl/MRDRNA2_/MRDRNA2_78032_c0_seq1:4-507(-)
MSIQMRSRLSSARSYAPSTGSHEVSCMWAIEEKSAHNPNGFFTEGWFLNAKGLRIHTYSARPENDKPKGVVILLHGIMSHALLAFLVRQEGAPPGAVRSLRGSFVQAFLDAGFIVYLYDQQGHGLSDAVGGLHGYVESMEDLTSDLQQMSHLVFFLPSATVPKYSYP